MASSELRSVDKLTLRFLVDNSIEWMTTLPPGFTHELPQHLDGSNEIEPDTGTPILNFDKFCCGAHGLSILITTQIEGEESHTTLFDTGPDTISLIRNIKSLKVDTGTVERVILSHWHSDHSGGMLSFLEHRRQASFSPVEPCIVDLHPNRPDLRGIAPGPDFDKVICALPRDPSFDALEKAGGIVEKHSDGHVAADGTVWVSGEIPRVTSFEEGIKGGMRLVGGSWTSEENIMDERYAAVDVAGKGLIVFSSCSHAGIVNVIKDAVNKFSRPIYMIIGGLHLAGKEYSQRIPLTVDFLVNQLKPGPTYVLPMHCSGFQAKVALEDAFGEGCVPCSTGMKYAVVGDRGMDDRLYTASY